MRRTVVVVGVAFAIVGGFTPEVVAAPKASVTDSVERGSEITIIATDCKSGPDFTAYLDIEVEPERSPFYDTYEYETDADGTTEIKITMTVVGKSWVRVGCMHWFSDADTPTTFYAETEEVDVIEKSGTLTKAEKKKCKKKKTSEKRRKCRQRQAAD